MSGKKFLNLEGLTTFFENLQNTFSSKDHTHEVDSALSSTSTNPVQNKVVNSAISSNLSSAKSYTDSEVAKVTGGTIIVKEAEHAESADTATSATSATSATKAAQDASGNVITETYETKTDASAKLAEAKSYADSAATTVKNDLLNGAGEAYDTLKELGELIDTNVDAIDALETVATNKADKEHTHTISEITDMPEVANADWSENDPESAAYIQNRTHYDISTESTVLSETSVDLTEDFADQLSNCYHIADQSFDIGINIDKIYKVIWDGVEYVCTPFKLYGGGQIWFNCIGNKSLYGDTDEFEDTPFLICEQTYHKSLYAKESGVHTISAIEVAVEIVKIDEKYLPDNAMIGALGENTGAEIFNAYGENEASGSYSHAEGRFTVASGSYGSHAEGYSTVASGSNGSHAEGDGTVASGAYSHAEGLYTIASSAGQHVQGEYNIEDTDYVYAHIVGNGDEEVRSNAHTLDWDGNAWYAGSIYVGGTVTSVDGVANYSGASEVALKSDFESLVVAITNDEIDAICGTSIAVASEEEF